MRVAYSTPPGERARCCSSLFLMAAEVDCEHKAEMDAVLHDVASIGLRALETQVSSLV